MSPSSILDLPMIFFFKLVLLLVALSSTNLVRALYPTNLFLFKYELAPNVGPNTSNSAIPSLNFSVCLCSSDALPAGASPKDASQQCRCHKVVPGGKNCAKFFGAASKPCWMAGIKTEKPAKSGYIRASLLQDNNRSTVLTKPEWQPLDMDAPNGSTLSIPPIVITYIIRQGNKIMPKKTFKIGTTKLPEATTTTIIVQKQTKTEGPPPAAVTPLAQNYGPVPWELLTRMGEDEFQIRTFLRMDARVQRVHPHQFDVERFKKQIVRISNRYRWMHQVSDLVLDAPSETNAQQWADTLGRNGECLRHELRFGGENLFMFSNLEPYLTNPETMAEAVMKSFYLEGRAYYSMPVPDPAASGAFHFTQMLWRGSRRIGVGVAIRALPSGMGPCVPGPVGGKMQAWMFYVVLRYDPIGNQAYPGNGYMENVLPQRRMLQ